MAKNKLPNKLSALMRVALANLAKVERSPKFNIDMTDDWVSFDGFPDGKVSDLIKKKNSVCHVCFAGAVMAKTLDVEVEDGTYYFDGGMSSKDTNKMCALDDVRQGSVYSALISMEVKQKQVDKYIEKYRHGWEPVTPYDEDRKEWRKDMWRIVRRLERVGL